MRFALFMPFAYLAGIDGFAMFAAYAVFVGLFALTVQYFTRRRSVGQRGLEGEGVASDKDLAPATVSWA